MDDCAEGHVLAARHGAPGDRYVLCGASLSLDEALTSLAVFDPALARVVELRFFTGLTIDEVAGVLDVSASTVKREWVAAKAWLSREMGKP